MVSLPASLCLRSCMVRAVYQFQTESERKAGLFILSNLSNLKLNLFQVPSFTKHPLLSLASGIEAGDIAKGGREEHAWLDFCQFVSDYDAAWPPF